MRTNEHREPLSPRGTPFCGCGAVHSRDSHHRSAVSRVFCGDQRTQRFGCRRNGAFVQRVGRGVRSMRIHRVAGRPAYPPQGLTITLVATGACAAGVAYSLKPPARPPSSSRSSHLSSAQFPRSSHVGYCARRSRTSQWAWGSSRSLPLS